MMSQATDPWSPPQAAFNANLAAERLSANGFFNALLRETGAGVWVLDKRCAVPDGITHPAVRIDLPDSKAGLWLSVTHRSDCGRHQFAPPIVHENTQGNSEPINFALAVRAVVDEPAIFPQAEADQRQRFVERSQSSMRNMAQAIAARKNDLERLFTQPMDFAESEQALLCGHSMHPTPKSREPFTDADAGHYAPEFGNAFALQWLALAPEQMQGTGSYALSAEDLARQVFESDDLDQDLPKGLIPIPMHPWQWQRLRSEDHYSRHIKQGRIIELGEGRKAWRATSSLRAVHAPHSPYMLKFSLSLRLTNSLRTLLPHEMARGLEVPQVRATPVGREFADRYPQFTVLAEPAYIMLRDCDGHARPESMALFRENPFRERAAENSCLLATLTQDHPTGEPARAAQLISMHARRHDLSIAEATRQWFGRFLDVVVEPLIIAQADYGLLYGAHQQNVIIRFDRELPQAGYFRDCQGSGYSQLGERLLRPYIPGLGSNTENVIDDRMANRLFAYYLIVNSCFGLISAIGAARLVKETDLLLQLRQRLAELNAGPRQDRSCLNYLLKADEIWAKGNFHCAIIGMNESTTDDPLAIYHGIPNVLKDLGTNRLRKTA